MNYYNPYYGMYPSYITSATRPGLFSKLTSGIKNINFGSILSGTQKTLNIVNQTIPLVKQATPVFKNAKTMFKVMNEFKKVDTPTTSINTNKKNITSTETEINENIENKRTINNDGPTFFL